jgi:glutathione S-transferase
MSKPKLYSNDESGNCYKVRLLASLLKIDLEYPEFDYFGGQHRTPEYLAINPRGEIPSLVHGKRTLTDSSAILVYLAGTYPEPGYSEGPSSFWSSDVGEQAEIVEWLAFSAGWISEGVRLARNIVTFGGLGGFVDTSEEAHKRCISKGIKSLELLQKKFEKDDWLALGRPTVADIAVFVYVALAPMGDISLEPYPAVRGWIERIKKLPGFITTLGIDDPHYRKKGNN